MTYAPIFLRTEKYAAYRILSRMCIDTFHQADYSKTMYTKPLLIALIALSSVSVGVSAAKNSLPATDATQAEESKICLHSVYDPLSKKTIIGCESANIFEVHELPAFLSSYAVLRLASEAKLDLNKSIVVPDTVLAALHEQGRALTYFVPGEHARIDQLIKWTFFLFSPDATITLQEDLRKNFSKDFESEIIQSLNLKSTSFDSEKKIWITSPEDIAVLLGEIAQLLGYFENFRNLEKNLFMNSASDPTLWKVSRSDTSALLIFEHPSEKYAFGIGRSHNLSHPDNVRIVSGCVRDNRNLDGTPTNKMTALLARGANEFATLKIFDKYQKITELEVSNGVGKRIDLVTPHAVYITLSENDLNESNNQKVETFVLHSETTSAPIKTGENIAELSVRYKGVEVAHTPLVAKTDITESNFFIHFFKAFEHIKRDFYDNRK